MAYIWYSQPVHAMTPLSTAGRAALLTLTLALPLAACGGDDAAPTSRDAIEDTGEPGLIGRARGMAAAAEQMQQAAERPPAEPVNFRVLRDLLPATLPGMERTSAEGATQGAMGFSISEAEATYTGTATDDASPRIDIKITDGGALPSMAMMGAAWTMAEVDRETADGYEKTVTMGGNRGFRKYDTASRDGEFSLSVADRFLVVVTGTDVDDAAIEAALRTVDMGALNGMRDQGRPAAE